MKKTNKYIKYIKRLSIMIVTMLLSFTIMTQKTFAYFSKGLTAFGENYASNFQVIDGILYAQTNYETIKNNQSVYTIYLDEVLYDLVNHGIFDTYYFVFQGVNLQVDDGTIHNLVHVTLIELDISEQAIYFMDSTYEVLLYYENTIPILTTKTFSIAGFSQDYQDGYNNGYNDGLDVGYDDGYDIGYDDGYINGYGDGYGLARYMYGKKIDDVWHTAEEWGNIEYNRGLQAGQGEAYNQGYIDGSNDIFLASIKDWIVPAIIVVLFLGGAVSVIIRKREG